MRTASRNSIRWSLKLGVFCSLLGGLIAISQSSLAAADELVPTALAIDLMLTVPLIYFLMIRKTAVPKITAVPVFLACFLIASSVLPEGVEFVGFAGLFLIPSLELGALAYLGYRIYRTQQAFRDEQLEGLDLMERLRNAFVRELKPAVVARAAAFEIGVLAYIMFVWRMPDGTSFSYHRQNGTRALLIILLFLLGVETIVLHLLLALLNEIVALIATALSIYFAMQVLAHLKAVSLRPIVVTDQDLFVRCGILGDVVIPRVNIDSVEPIIGITDTAAFDLLPIGKMSQPNVRLHLREPATVYGIYGLAKPVKRLQISVDDPAGFADAIRL